MLIAWGAFSHIRIFMIIKLRIIVKLVLFHDDDISFSFEETICSRHDDNFLSAILD